MFAFRHCQCLCITTLHDIKLIIIIMTNSQCQPHYIPIYTWPTMRTHLQHHSTAMHMVELCIHTINTNQRHIDSVPHAPQPTHWFGTLIPQMTEKCISYIMHPTLPNDSSPYLGASSAVHAKCCHQLHTLGGGG